MGKALAKALGPKDYLYSIAKAMFEKDKVDMEYLKDLITHHSSDLFSNLETYQLFHQEFAPEINEEKKCFLKYVRFIIDKMSMYFFKMPIEMAIATKEQTTIKAAFYDIAEVLGLDDYYQTYIDYELEQIANTLNKRFTFDDISLIRLIEASKSTNIQLEEDIQRINEKNHKRQILKQKSDGTFYLADIDNHDGTHTYTSGKDIPFQQINKNGRQVEMISPDEAKYVQFGLYPGAKELFGKSNPNEILKEIMTNLFEDLDLCAETYKFYYAVDQKKPLEESKAVLNKVVLSNKMVVEFKYQINPENLPHLLGIQSGSSLSDEAINYLNLKGECNISKTSSAIEVFKALMKNKERIISDGGLIGIDKKMYQLLPWEKIILKTSSFMRGDFFKTCFCLAMLRYGINNPNEKFASISSLEYNQNMINSNFDPKRVLRSLMDATSQRKDFIFRTFIHDEHALSFIPNSILTGKSENIITNKGVRIKSLNRLRNAIDYSEDAIVAGSIENDNMGERIFSPAEQIITKLSVAGASGLGLSPVVSEEAKEFERELSEAIKEEIEKDLGGQSKTYPPENYDYDESLEDTENLDNPHGRRKR